jgi:hypothetical protein
MQTKGCSPEVTSMLSETFHDAHLAFAHLALNSPVAHDNGDDLASKLAACPLVQPYLFQLSDQLSSATNQISSATNIIDVVKDKLKNTSAH